MFTEQRLEVENVSSRKSHALMDKTYRYFFGLSSKRQVGWRLSVDLFLANAALIFGVTARAVYVGQITATTSFAGAFGHVILSYASLLIVFNLLAITLLAGSRIYRPLPSGRLMKRLTLTAAACGLANCKGGSLASFSGAADAVSPGLIDVKRGSYRGRDLIRRRSRLDSNRAKPTLAVVQEVAIGGGYVTEPRTVPPGSS